MDVRGVNPHSVLQLKLVEPLDLSNSVHDVVDAAGINEWGVRVGTPSKCG